MRVGDTAPLQQPWQSRMSSREASGVYGTGNGQNRPMTRKSVTGQNGQ